MESRGLPRRDLEPFLGSRARVAEVLNRRRPLTIDMIRKLSREASEYASIRPSGDQEWAEAGEVSGPDVGSP